jgi:hypothetical protein
MQKSKIAWMRATPQITGFRRSLRGCRGKETTIAVGADCTTPKKAIERVVKVGGFKDVRIRKMRPAPRGFWKTTRIGLVHKIRAATFGAHGSSQLTGSISAGRKNLHRLNSMSSGQKGQGPATHINTFARNDASLIGCICNADRPSIRKGFAGMP